MKRSKFISILIIILILFTLEYVGEYVFDSVINIQDKIDTRFKEDNEYFTMEGFDYDKFKDEYNIKDFTIESRHGDYQIPVSYISNGEINRDTVVIAHGIASNRKEMFPVGEIFLENGFNVISYDQRNSNENNQRYNTYGLWESKDFIDCVNYVYENIDEDKLIGGLGFSMGGGSVGIASGDPEMNRKLDFAILDSSVLNLEDPVRIQMENMGLGILSKPLITLGDLNSRLEIGLRFSDIDVTRGVSSNYIDTLIISSRYDEVTPTYMAEKIYQAIPHDNKELKVVDYGNHAHICTSNPKEYRVIIKEFLKDVRKGRRI